MYSGCVRCLFGHPIYSVGNFASCDTANGWLADDRGTAMARSEQIEFALANREYEHDLFGVIQDAGRNGGTGGS
jgi:hypothetical protein